MRSNKNTLSPRSSFSNTVNDDQSGQNTSENARVKVIIRIRPLSPKEKLEDIK